MNNVIEKATTEEKILISQNDEGINQVRSIAQNNVNTLNRVYEISGMYEEDKILFAANNRKQFILNKLYERYPEAKRQAEYSKIEFALPSDLEGLDRILQGITVNTFKYVYWSKKLKKFDIDYEDLERACDRFKTWAVTPEQIERRKFQEQYYDFIMNKLKPGEFALRKFYMNSELLTYHPSKGVVMNDRFVFESYRF